MKKPILALCLLLATVLSASAQPGGADLSGRWILSVSGFEDQSLVFYADGTGWRGDIRCSWEVKGKILIIRESAGKVVFEFYPVEGGDHLAVLLRQDNYQ
jgi:hypothetical protein